MDLQEDKKRAVLHQLSQESEPVSLSELLEKLGENFVDRSVRRWLAEMVTNGLLEKSGTTRGTKYRIIQKENRIGNCFSSESVNAIQQVRRPIFERMPISYDDQWFNSYEPNITHFIPFDLRNQLRKAGERSTKANEPAGTYAHQIFNRLLIDLSYNSSRLEGNTYSLLDTQRLVLEGTGAEGKLEEEKIMILNHKDAIRYVVDSAPRIEVSEETICTLHYLLSDGLIDAHYTGKVRDHGVRIGGSTYIPFEDPSQLQIRLKRIVKKASQILDPYEQSLFLLIHISYLQAFSDVNKRTARLSANIPLIKHNLVPLSFNDVERDDYMTAMIAIYELQDFHPLLDLYLFSYMRTCAAYDSTVRAIGFDEVRVRYRQQRRALMREIITNHLIGVPLKQFITAEMEKLVKKEEQTEFYQDVLEDLKYLDMSRIAGLGITPDQLNSYLMAARASSDFVDQ